MLAPAAGVLMDEIVEEILLRFPPDDPATLVRAALVCKPWCRLVSGPAFHRGFRDLHGTRPTLGFLCNLLDNDGNHVASSPFCPPHADYLRWSVLDARHGRVLLRVSSKTSTGNGLYRRGAQCGCVKWMKK